MWIWRSLKSWLLRTPDGIRGPNDGDIGSDAPIRSAAQDVLRRSQFADRIASILSQLTLEEGRVFAVRGPWGAGKSSLKNLVIEQLQTRSDGTTWLEFNPWQWGDSDAIAKALFKQIAEKLGGSLSSAAGRRASKFRRYGTALSGSGASLASIGKGAHIPLVLANVSVIAMAASIGFELPSAAKVAAAFAVASIVLPLAGKIMLSYGKDRWAEPLDTIRSELEESLRQLAKPLVVFVDDIDRLEHDQIRLLIRQIKVNANLPNIVFVLLFQPSIVEAALKPVANEQGREFLKKIVQANFDLPAVSKSVVHGVMTAELDRVVGDYADSKNGFEEVRWGNALIGGIQPFVSNLRDARRYISSVSIHLPLHIGENVMEVNVIDFLCLEALRVFEPDVHASIFEERELLLQSGRHRSDSAEEENRKLLKAFVERASEGNRLPTESALQQLFPQTEWAFGGSHYDHNEWGPDWTSARRVCSPRFFTRYFEMQTPPGEISENEFASFLSAAGDRESLRQMFESIEERDLLRSLAGRLRAAVDLLPTDHASVLLPTMFALAQMMVEPSTPINSSWNSAWSATSLYIARIAQQHRGALALTALRETGALSVAAIIIRRNDTTMRLEGSIRDPYLDDASVNALKSEWLTQVTARALDIEGFLREPDLMSHLYRWRDYTGSLDAPRSWVQSAIENDAGFVALVGQFVSSGSSHTSGDLVSSKTYNIDATVIDDLIGAEEARVRLARLSRSDLTADQQRALQILGETLDGRTID